MKKDIRRAPREESYSWRILGTPRNIRPNLAQPALIKLPSNETKAETSLTVSSLFAQFCSQLNFLSQNFSKLRILFCFRFDRNVSKMTPTLKTILVFALAAVQLLPADSTPLGFNQVPTKSTDQYMCCLKYLVPTTKV